MKILITSGQTKIAIDSVRHIGNMSHGTLGSRMAKEFLEKGHEIIFFRSEGSKSPMSITFDFYKDKEHPNYETWYAFREFYYCFNDFYTEKSYKGFYDYQSGLKELIETHKPDMIVLAAAVSDYEPETTVNGKIRTKENLNIQLKPLPKVISSVREWARKDTKIVGFKLLVDVSEQELLDAAKESVIKNKLDCVCANDLRSILNGDHTLFVCDQESVVKCKNTELTDVLLSR